jgi:tetratricopeptide (TPR) repeat protein
MSDGSIDIDDTQGDVSGIIKNSIGSIGAKIINGTGIINNYANLVITNATNNEEATLRKIQDVSTETNAIEKGIITRQEFDALYRALIEIKNLLERNQAYSIKAGNVQVSRIELLLKEIILKGNEQFHRGRLSVALNYYDQAIKIDPNYAAAWYNKGWALSNLGKHKEALECYDKIDANNAYAWNNKGVALNNLRRYKDAIVCYDRAIKIDPNDANAWYVKGLAAKKLGKQCDAARCFTKAKELGLQTHPKAMLR